VWGLGRYIPRVQRVAEQTDVDIVVATGLSTDDEVPHQYEHRGPGLLLDLPRDPMADDFTRDVRDGLADTGVRAAFLGCVVEAKGLTPGVERTPRACAATHPETGAPITVHTSSPARSGRSRPRRPGRRGADRAELAPPARQR
jgi:phosphotriesterase-related protein